MKKQKITPEEFLELKRSKMCRTLDISSAPGVNAQIKHIFDGFIVYEGRTWGNVPIYYKEEVDNAQRSYFKR